MLAFVLVAFTAFTNAHPASDEVSSALSPSTDSAKVSVTANGVSFNMIKVEGGTFTMGATPEQGDDVRDYEEPMHKVTLSTYYIGETEVTQGLWKTVMGENPSHFKGDSLPVENVNWEDCEAFIAKLNELTGKKFALPTEAQWEFAARGGNKSKGTKYAGGKKLQDVAWYTYNSGNKTQAVGMKNPNELGLYDMSGNVCEWCADWWGEYSSAAAENPTGPATGVKRCFRGGSWVSAGWLCRPATRFARPIEEGRTDDIGLRVVMVFP